VTLPGGLLDLSRGGAAILLAAGGAPVALAAGLDVEVEIATLLPRGERLRARIARSLEGGVGVVFRHDTANLALADRALSGLGVQQAA
jgi:hypothetical protein